MSSTIEKALAKAWDVANEAATSIGRSNPVKLVPASIGIRDLDIDAVADGGDFPAIQVGTGAALVTLVFQPAFGGYAIDLVAVDNHDAYYEQRLVDNMDEALVVHTMACLAVQF